MAVTSPAALLSGGLTGGITDALKDIAPKSSATSGDATAGPISNSGYDFGFAQTSPFNVGSGSASGSANASAATGQNSALLYVSIAVAVLALLFEVSRRK